MLSVVVAAVATMDESCWGAVHHKVIRACDIASLECWEEVQVKEFLYYKKNTIRDDITKRKHDRLKKLKHADAVPVQAETTAAAAAAATTADEKPCNPIIIIDESDTEENESSPSAPAKILKRKRAIRVQLPLTKQPPTASATVVHPSTLERLLHKLQNDQKPPVLDPPECQHPSCPYCKKSLMEQRYLLALRLVQIEHALYGEHAEIRLP